MHRRAWFTQRYIRNSTLKYLDSIPCCYKNVVRTFVRMTELRMSVIWPAVGLLNFGRNALRGTCRQVISALRENFHEHGH